MSAHEAIWRAYLTHVGIPDRMREKHGTGHPATLHRLAHLVPEICPDQETLARVLAELVLQYRRDSLTGNGRHYLVRELMQEARDEEQAGRHGFKRLAAYARTNAEAWDACVMLLDHVHPAPDPISELMRDHFTGKQAKPPKSGRRFDPAETHWKQGAAVLMIHAAAQSALKPTRNEYGTTERAATRAAVDVVHDVLAKNAIYIWELDSLINVWKARSKQYRAPVVALP